MKFAMAAYGWPIFMMMNTGTGLCKLLPYLRYVTWGSPWLPTVGPSSWWWIQGLGCVNCCLTSGMSHEVRHGCLRLAHLHDDEYRDWTVPYLRYVTWCSPWLPTVDPSPWWWIQGLDCVNWCHISGMDDQNEHEVCHGCLWLAHRHEDEYRDWTV